MKKLNYNDDRQIVECAYKFSRRLKGYLTDEEFRELQSLTREENRISICHSHDYLDANEVMFETLDEMSGNTFVFNLLDEPQTAFIDKAWNIAKDKLFVLSEPLYILFGKNAVELLDELEKEETINEELEDKIFDCGEMKVYYFIEEQDKKTAVGLMYNSLGYEDYAIMTEEQFLKLTI